MADHFPVQVVIKAVKVPKAPLMKFKSRNFHKGDYRGIIDDIRNIGIDQLTFPEDVDIDNAWSDFHGLLWPLVETYFPEVEHLAKGGIPL